MPRKYSFVRECNVCKKITAIDLDGSLEHKKEMEMEGQTIYEMDEAGAIDLWRTRAGHCQCGMQQRILFGDSK